MLSYAVSYDNNMYVLNSFRVFTVLVATRLSVLNSQEEIPKAADHRYESDKQPPSAFTDIMHTTYTNSNHRQKHSQIINTYKYANRTQNSINNTCDNSKKIAMNKTNIQYSRLLALPSKSFHFFKTSMYSFIFQIF